MEAEVSRAFEGHHIRNYLMEYNGKLGRFVMKRHENTLK